MNRVILPGLLWPLAMLLALANQLVVAHESRPIYIEINETAPETYRLQWKVPPSIPAFNLPTVALPSTCQAQTALAEFEGPDGMVRRVAYRCRNALAGTTVAIVFPGPNPSVSSLIRYSVLSGEKHFVVLGPEESSWTVPQNETALGVARQYTALGMEHIWGGTDHLLFLVCLLWIAGTWRRILITITGFTFAHSLTLILSALQLIRLPVPPVEASIALSIVFLASEMVRGRRHTLAWRYPIAVASSFGLLHGLGFAAALREIGLPQTELLTGLFFFNVGVEVGQLLFAAGVLGLICLTQKFWTDMFAINHPEALARTVGGYAVGALATFWLIERVTAF